MEKGGLVHLGVDELREAVGQGVDAVAQFENAWAGVAEASGEGREEAAIEAVVEDILSGGWKGLERWKSGSGERDHRT